MMNFCSVSQAHGLEMGMGMRMEKEPATVTVSSLHKKRGTALLWVFA